MKINNQEMQREGRNKSTLINQTYIESGEYRKKFDNISDSKVLNRLLYQLSKKILYHRSGTLIEDMYWIDADTTKIVAYETSQTHEEKIVYSKKNKIHCKKEKRSHNHPFSSKQFPTQYRRF